MLVGRFREREIGGKSGWLDLHEFARIVTKYQQSVTYSVTYRFLSMKKISVLRVG